MSLLLFINKLMLPTEKDIIPIDSQEYMLTEYKNFHRWILFTILNTIWSNSASSPVLNFVYKCAFRLFSGFVASHIHQITQYNLNIYYLLITISFILLSIIIFNNSDNNESKYTSYSILLYIIILICSILYKKKQVDKKDTKTI